MFCPVTRGEISGIVKLCSQQRRLAVSQLVSELGFFNYCPSWGRNLSRHRLARPRINEKILSDPLDFFPNENHSTVDWMIHRKYRNSTPPGKLTPCASLQLLFRQRPLKLQLQHPSLWEFKHICSKLPPKQYSVRGPLLLQHIKMELLSSSFEVPIQSSQCNQWCYLGCRVWARATSTKGKGFNPFRVICQVHCHCHCVFLSRFHSFFISLWRREKLLILPFFNPFYRQFFVIKRRLENIYFTIVGFIVLYSSFFFFIL